MIVTPAKAGVQEILNSLDSGFRRNDGSIQIRDRIYETETLVTDGQDGGLLGLGAHVLPVCI